MVLANKKPHIGNTIIHPTNGLYYAYYGTVATQERVEALTKKFNKERQWVFVHEVPDIGFSIFHRHATLEHAKQPFGKVPPKEYIPIEQALKAAEKPKKHAQSEPGSKDVVIAKPARVVLSEQEKRAKKMERRALRRLKKKEKKSEAVVQSVLGQLRPDLRL